MQIHEIEGKTMRDALERARAELGEQAVVITHRSRPGAVALAVAAEVPRSTADLEELRREARRLLVDERRSPRRAVPEAMRATSRGACAPPGRRRR